eukprot:2876024-Rhodomonas_salina.3
MIALRLRGSGYAGGGVGGVQGAGSPAPEPQRAWCRGSAEAGRGVGGVHGTAHLVAASATPELVHRELVCWRGARVLAEGVHAEGVHGTASDDLCLSCNDIGAEGGGGAWRVQGAGSFELQRHFNWIGADTCWQGCLGT